MTTRRQAANAAIQSEFAAHDDFEVAADQPAVHERREEFEADHDAALQAVRDDGFERAEVEQAVQIEHEITEASLPAAHAARLGDKSQLIAQGLHVPGGSTTQESIGPVFEPVVRERTRRYDPRDNQVAFIGEHASYVTLMGGNMGAVKKVLSEFTQKNGVEKLIEAEGSLSNGKPQLGLSMLLDRVTVANLATLGAEYTGSFKTPTAERVIVAAAAKAKAAEVAAGAQPAPATM